MNPIQNILRTIKLILLTIISGAQAGIAYAKTYGESYVVGLAWLVALAVLLPLPFAVVGVFHGVSWLTATAGLLWGIALLIPSFWGIPLGTLVGTLWSGANTLATAPKTGFFVWRWIGWWIDLPGRVLRSVKDGAMWYVGFVRGVILAELIITFGLSIVPIKNNFAAVPLLFLAITVVWISAVHWKIENPVWKKLIRWMAIFTVVVLLLSFFFPETSKEVAKKFKPIDRILAEKVATNGLASLLPGWSSTQRDTNGLVVYRVSLGETNVFIPDRAQLVVVEMTRSNFSGWIHIPLRWRNAQWQEGEDKGIFIQGFGQDEPTWVAPGETWAIPWSVFRVKGEGTFTLTGR